MAKETHNALAGSRADDPTVLIFKGLLKLPREYVTKVAVPISNKDLRKAVRLIATGTTLGTLAGRIERERVTKGELRLGTGPGQARSAKKLARDVTVRKVYGARSKGGLA